MKRYLKNLLITSAAVLALSVPSFAQLQQTFETTSLFEGTQTGVASGRAFVQTFSSASQLQSVTYRFASNVNNSTATTLNVYFSLWNTTTNKAVGPALVQTTATVTAGNTFTTFQDANLNNYQGFDLQLTLAQTLQSDLTYALILVGTANGSQVNLTQATAGGGDNFTFGAGALRSSGVPTGLAAGFTNLTSTATSFIDGTTDWGFSAISITIVPEPSTAAAALVAGFLGVMVIRRRFQRTKVQPVLAA